MYRRFRKVSFKECLAYYSTANEEPSGVLVEDDLQQKQLFSSIPSSFPQFIRRQEDLHAQKKSESCPHQLISGEGLTPVRVSRDDALRLFYLIPRGNECDIGHSVPTEEELNEFARPVPQELIDAQVDWVNHGFYYKFGN